MKNGKALYLAGQIASPQGLKDGTMKFTVYLNEQTPEKIGQLFMLNNQYVYLGLKREDFMNAEKDALESLESGEIIGKTPSKRLKAVLFLNWEKDKEGFQDFDGYYKHKMERIIEHYKAKLD